MFDPVITIDVDWAPDYMIEPMAEVLIERGVRATWLLTHASPSVEVLHSRPDLFELGIHPNFHPGSSHGGTPEEVVDHCMDLVPSARCVRTHGLLQSTPLLYELGRRGALQIDLSLFLHRCRNAAPIRFDYRDASLLRLPHVWEDDMEMACSDPNWRIDPILGFDGLKILVFHPVHVFLNCATGEKYEAFKRRASVDADAASIARRLQCTAEGPATMFRESIDYLAGRGGGKRIGDLAAQFNDNGKHPELTLSCDEKDAAIHWLKQRIRDIEQATKVKGVELPHERPRP